MSWIGYIRLMFPSSLLSLFVLRLVSRAYSNTTVTPQHSVQSLTMDLYYKLFKVDICEAYIVAKSKSEPYKCFIRPGRFFIDLVYINVTKPFSSSRDSYK